MKLQPVFDAMLAQTRRRNTARLRSGNNMYLRDGERSFELPRRTTRRPRFSSIGNATLGASDIRLWPHGEDQAGG